MNSQVKLFKIRVVTFTNAVYFSKNSCRSEVIHNNGWKRTASFLAVRQCWGGSVVQYRDSVALRQNKYLLLDVTEPRLASYCSSNTIFPLPRHLPFSLFILISCLPHHFLYFISLLLHTTIPAITTPLTSLPIPPSLIYIPVAISSLRKLLKYIIASHFLIANPKLHLEMM